MLVQPSLLPNGKPVIHEAGTVTRPDHFAIVKRLIAETKHPTIDPTDTQTLLSLDQVLRAGGCHRPVRLVGAGHKVDTGTGEILGPWSTDSLPHGVTYVACKTRRGSRCSVCAWLYQGDAYQLIVAGLRGGKDTTDAVANRPALFITLTAPGFGAVHTQRRDPKRRRRVTTCNAGGGSRRCKHGTPVTCHVAHDDDDELLGQPLCRECFDYRSAALWNASSSELWRRTRINLDRALATALGVVRSKLTEHLRIQYVKVAEFQRRGLVHFHLAVRVDGPDIDSDPPIDADQLTKAFETAIAKARLTMPNGKRARWGNQHRIIPIVVDTDNDEEVDHPEDRRFITRGQAAGYLGKYATKSADGNDALDHRIYDESYIRTLKVNPHLRRLVRTSWNLATEFPDFRGDAWAHQLGHRGHFLTKSRSWSTTFRSLRQARQDHQSEIRQASWDAASPQFKETVVARWQYFGSGYVTATDGWIADTFRKTKEDERQNKREEVAA